MTLTKEQVELLDAEGVELALKQFNKAHKVEKPLTAEVYANLDSIANTLLWLEDRQSFLRASAHAIENNKARWGKE